MASDERRAAAGAAGVNTTVAGTKKRAKASKQDRREHELKVLKPVRLEFTILRDGREVPFAVPSEFTIGDIVDRAALDDLDKFWRLTIRELEEIMPAGIGMKEFVTDPRYVEYLAIAFSDSRIRKLARYIASRVARVIDEDGLITTGRVTVDELEQLSTHDMHALELWFTRRYSDLVNNSKNSARTTRA